MVDVTGTLSIPEEELEERFIQTSGPGGQHVNKVATAVQLRFDVARSPSLPEPVRQRLVQLARRRINRDGELVIEAQRYRSQDRNRQDARDRLVRLIREAMKQPKRRKRTRPTLASRRHRLESKRRRGELKRARQQPEM